MPPTEKVREARWIPESRSFDPRIGNFVLCSESCDIVIIISRHNNKGRVSQASRNQRDFASSGRWLGKVFYYFR